MKTIQITDKKHRGQRVDLFLTKEYPHVSRKSIKEAILQHAVLANEKEIMPNYRLSVGDEIQIHEIEFDKVTHKMRNQAPTLKARDLHLEIVYEDEHTLLIDKPHNLPSQPRHRNDTLSVVNGALSHLQQSGSSTNIQPKLVHRLDKGTSGLILLSKSTPAHYFYTKQFENRQVKKEYLCVVDSSITKKLHGKSEFEISEPLSIQKNDQNQYVVSHNLSLARHAKTNFTLIEMTELGTHKYAVLKAEPRTGRSHQIRVHTAHFGFPILGDELYGGAQYKRLMLHAWKLSFTPYEKKEVRMFESKQHFLGDR